MTRRCKYFQERQLRNTPMIRFSLTHIFNNNLTHFTNYSYVKNQFFPHIIDSFIITPKCRANEQKV